MIYIFSIIFVLSVLVFFHELGHFLFAKLFGVRVEKFSIGFPPRLFGFKWGDTDYCISAIPFGGYVKMAGVVDESMDTETLTGADYEFASKKWWQKVLILTGGVLMNVILAWGIQSALLHTQGEPIIPGTSVGYILEGSHLANAGMQVKDKIISINGAKVNSWNDIRDEYLANLDRNITFEISRNGEILSIKTAKPISQGDGGEQLDIAPMMQSRIGNVVPNTVASKAELQRGDRITSIHGQPVESWDEMTKLIRNNPGIEMEFLIERDGAVFSKMITPETASEIDKNGQDTKVGKIGIGIFYDKREIDFIPAIVEGFNKTVFFTVLNVKALGWLVTGKKSPKEMIGGPIMITKMAGDFAKSGFASLMELIAHLSIMLAIINILPIPALDGGHIVIVLIEQIRRKPLTTQSKLRIQQWGMGILFALMIFVIYNDFMRLF